MKCPNCGLINPPNAIKCDCGYNFKTNQVENILGKKEKTMAKTDLTSQESRRSPQTSIIIGTILFIAGLIGILMRDDITVAIVGRGQVMHEAFFGGSSTSTALIAITTISAIAMISGLIIFVLGIIRANAKPNNNDHDSMFCPYCGTKLEGDNEFCPECGKHT